MEVLRQPRASNETSTRATETLQTGPRRFTERCRWAYLSTDYAYEITFYTRPNGIIYKTLAKKNQDAANELNWK